MANAYALAVYIARATGGRGMAEPSPDKIVVSIVGSLIGATLGWLPGGLSGATGSPLTVLLAAVGGISGLVFSLM
jgi:hypothetical protein